MIRNRDPDGVLDTAVFVQRLPVARDDLALAGIPNGYFDGDLDVAANHAVIRRLQDAHGYRFAGIGADWLGFVRAAAPTPEQARAVVTDLRHVYSGGTPGDVPEAAWATLAEVITARPTLLVAYTEGFAERVAGQ